MSRILLLEELNEEEKNRIHKELTLRIKPSKFSMYATPEIVYMYEILDNYLHVPFAYDKNIPRPKKLAFSNVNYTFEGVLYENQKKVLSDTISCLNKTGSYILASYTGFGKSTVAVALMSQVKLKTMILISKIVLVKQWSETILRLCPGTRIKYITASSTDTTTDDYDVIIMNAINVRKKPRSFFNDIGLVIVDEIHLIMSKVLSQSLQFLTPRYLLGLSATPYRTDGYDPLISMYFGTEKTYIPLYHPHTVYKVHTGFKPRVEIVNGSLNWGAILESQATDVTRNEMIVKIIKSQPERVILVITKRVEQANYLVSRLIEEKEDVTSLIGSNQEYDKKSRILVGTNSKVGVGFDHPRLNTLILATDILDYFLQCLGRIFRSKDSDAVVYDLVDDHGVLNKHYLEREKIYKSSGGTVYFNNFFNLN